jgi:broad specificity phosphatase PhoE
VTYVPVAGESQLHTQARIVAQMQAPARQHAGDILVCVSHATAIDLLVRHRLGLEVTQPPAFHIANTSVNIVTVQGGAWEVVTLNEVYHLEFMGCSESLLEVISGSTHNRNGHSTDPKLS